MEFPGQIAGQPAQQRAAAGEQYAGGGDVRRQFRPTTFMIDPEGNVFGYVQGAVSREIMDDIVEQTMTGQRR